MSTGSHANSTFWRGCARGFAGALLFSVPLLMTMEMWRLGFYIERERLLLFTALLLPLLYGLSRYSGFERTADWKADVTDALVAFAIGVVVAALALAAIAVLRAGMPARELLGKIILMTTPTSVGAVVASKQLGEQEEENRDMSRTAGYAGQLFIMAAGALFLCLNVAPTEEMVLIGYMMTPWHALVLAVLSVVVMHAIVFSLEFRGEAEPPPGMSFGRTFTYYTVVGYAIALLVSLYVLWTLGRLDGLALQPLAMSTVVLAFPAALGAAIARLII